MKTTINNIEIIEKYKSLQGNDYISRYDQNNFAANFFDSYFEYRHTNEIKDMQVKDRYNNTLQVRVVGKGEADDIQIYVVEHKNYNARKFRTEYKIYTTKEITKLNLKRVA